MGSWQSSRPGPDSDLQPTLSMYPQQKECCCYPDAQNHRCCSCAGWDVGELGGWVWVAPCLTQDPPAWEHSPGQWDCFLHCSAGHNIAQIHPLLAEDRHHAHHIGTSLGSRTLSASPQRSTDRLPWLDHLAGRSDKLAASALVQTIAYNTCNAETLCNGHVRVGDAWMVQNFPSSSVHACSTIVLASFLEWYKEGIDLVQMLIVLPGQRSLLSQHASAQAESCLPFVPASAGAGSMCLAVFIPNSMSAEVCKAGDFGQE